MFKWIEWLALQSSHCTAYAWHVWFRLMWLVSSSFQFYCQIFISIWNWLKRKRFEASNMFLKCFDYFNSGFSSRRLTYFSDKIIFTRPNIRLICQSNYFLFMVLLLFEIPLDSAGFCSNNVVWFGWMQKVLWIKRCLNCKTFDQNICNWLKTLIKMKKSSSVAPHCSVHKLDIFRMMALNVKFWSWYRFWLWFCSHFVGLFSSDGAVCSFSDKIDFPAKNGEEMFLLCIFACCWSDNESIGCIGLFHTHTYTHDSNNSETFNKHVNKPNQFDDKRWIYSLCWLRMEVIDSRADG